MFIPKPTNNKTFNLRDHDHDHENVQSKLLIKAVRNLSGATINIMGERYEYI
jgi:hypothetical protein